MVQQQVDPGNLLTLAQILQILVGAVVIISGAVLSWKQWKRQEEDKEAKSSSVGAAESLAQAGKLSADVYSGLIETIKGELDATKKEFLDYRNENDRRIADLNQQLETMRRQLLQKQETIDHLTDENKRLVENAEANRALITELRTENTQLRELLEECQHGSE